MTNTKNAKRGSAASMEFIEVGNTKSSRTVLMMHGYGANAEDLVELANYLDSDNTFRWIFLNAPLPLPFQFGPNSRAWFPIRISELEAAAKTDGESSFTRVPPEGIEHACSLVKNLISDLKLAASELVLGGFSQGAMMAIQICSKLEISPNGLLIFSGSLINSEAWRRLLPNHADTRFFQSHGTNDAVLGIANATRLNDLLNESGLKGSFNKFNGGHEIPLSIVKSAAHFLKDL